MFRFDKIKLIIWDLDETFWQGTLSEGSVVLPDEHKALLRNLTDAGIVNSICSKNDFAITYQVLQEKGVAEYFVFPSINWEAKGQRVKQLIADMQLRPANVLFLDDNPSNREEVRYFCPEIMVESPEIIPQLIKDAEDTEKKDPEHKRLQQYRVLETKHRERQNSSSNEAFLRESNIQLTIRHDCENQLERIHDLVLRSNQLNFTKIRSSQEELKALFRDGSIECGYVSVSDRFGDYGITGFYALRDNKLIHFVFSCRTLGMGIEQYVYNELNRPELNIAGEVVSDLSTNEKPDWINQKNGSSRAEKMKISNLQKHTVLIKGPCDLFQIYPYIADTEMFDTDFSHTTDTGIYIESTSHTTHLAEAVRLTEEQKALVAGEVPFITGDIYRSDMYTNPYKVVVISVLTDANLGIYRRKETGEHLAFLEYIQPVTDPANWQGLIEGTLLTNHFNFTQKILEDFSAEYEFIGRNTPAQTVENLRYIRQKLRKDCLLVIMLGGELYYEKNTFEAYKDRHMVHREMNKAIRDWAENIENVRLLDVNKYLTGQDCFYDHFNHYTKPIYYKLAKELVSVINQHIGSQIKNTSRLKMIKIRFKEVLAPYYYKMRKLCRK